jgi:PleD family two-component response regulator
VFELSTGSVELQGSVGVAFSSGGTDAEELIRRADAAMYDSKNVGAGRPVMAPAAA